MIILMMMATLMLCISDSNRNTNINKSNNSNSYGNNDIDDNSTGRITIRIVFMMNEHSMYISLQQFSQY